MLLKRCGLGLVMLLILQVHAQAQLGGGLRGGIVLGGPIPNMSNPDSSSGKMAIGPTLGGFVQVGLKPRLLLDVGLQYAFKGATYGQTFRRDTMMALEIFPGFTDTVPTYYVADVNGKMSLHYLDLPINLSWNIKGGAWLNVGAYGSLLLGGKDAGDLDIQIGDGTIFPDTVAQFDNIEEIRRLDAGLCLGGSYVWESGLFVEMRAQRSLVDLYRPGFMASQGMPGLKLYHTQFMVMAGMRF